MPNRVRLRLFFAGGNDKRLGHGIDDNPKRDHGKHARFVVDPTQLLRQHLREHSLLQYCMRLLALHDS